MGISTSGAALLIFASLLVSVGTYHAATTDALGRVSDAAGGQLTHADRIQETEIEILNASYDMENETLTIRIENIGDATLTTEATTFVVDGRYVPRQDFEIRTVDGQSTRTWVPDSTFRLVDTDNSVSERISAAVPERLKVVSGPGVARVSGVAQQ